MNRIALKELQAWFSLKGMHRKPLVLRGARQIGKSYLARSFCQKNHLKCQEINFEKEPSLQALFVEGDNSKTISLLEAHFRSPFTERSILFLDEIQAAPKVFSRLRYFYEESPQIALVAAGSLLEFALHESEYSVPVGRIQYLQLGPMTFEEYLTALDEKSLLELLKEWSPMEKETEIPDFFHQKLLEHVRDFSIIGGMPEVISRFIPKRDFLGAASVQTAILETYKQDFSKYRKRIPQERLERVFSAIPSQVGKKWVHARISQQEKAVAIEASLDALCRARIAHRVFHASGNGVPLSVERKENLYKVLFLDVGLMGAQLGFSVTHLIDPLSVIRVNEGALAEQWIGQHLLDLRNLAQLPELYYWVREKTGSLAEVDYLFSQGPSVFPVEVKSGTSSQAKSLKVFLAEKKSRLGIHFSLLPGRWDSQQRILQLPLYLVEQVPRLLELFT